MATELTCRCGHARWSHFAGRCHGSVYLDLLCDCTAFDDSRLPADGERLEFGVHRQVATDAETAPAWPSLDEARRRREAKVR